MQLAVSKLRSQSALKAFNKALQACKCDLGSWRERERLAPAQTALLDADNGAGWDLVQALLRPRKLEVHHWSQSNCFIESLQLKHDMPQYISCITNGAYSGPASSGSRSTMTCTF